MTNGAYFNLYLRFSPSQCIINYDNTKKTIFQTNFFK